MADEVVNELLENARQSLVRMQEFDVSKLPREAELGKSYSFSDAVTSARRLVDLFRRLSPEALDDFGKIQLDGLKQQADACFNLFDAVLQFDAKQANAHETKQKLIQQIEGAYQGAFNELLPLVGYSLHKSADFQRLDSEARATLQKIKDDAEEITKNLEQQKSDAESALEAIRKVAAEQGVTQQAIYFKDEADQNEIDAETWRKRTINIAWGLGGYAVLSIFIHKIPFLSPLNSYETVQMAVSKILIFSVISFILYLSSRNFLSHKHNAVVNRHRQNALMTYKTLVEAAGEKQQSSDAVLMHAAACIYAPQSTGYISGNSDVQGARSVIELLSKPISPSAE
ncbi:MAG TPA: hypothetical protein ENI80_11025 [Acidiferrobacteraceae bacterium]|nr:hypothetical protein [Acidiferrobacteraceae bacterium]